MSPRAVFACCALLFALNGYGASLIDALDNPSLFWVSGGQSAWFATTLESSDGIDAAQSGAVLDGEESWIETTVTGPGPLSFWWKVSSEEGWDRLQFLVDGVEQLNISGEVSWELRTLDIPSGVHVLRWRYAKDSSESGGLDRAWLDQVSYTPPGPFAPIIFENPASRTVAAGANVTFSVAAAGIPVPDYRWFRNGAPVPNGTNATLILLAVTSADAGVFYVQVSNPLGVTNSAPATLIVTIVGDVLEAPELNWIIGGEGSWFGQTAMTHDGVDALESGAILNQQESWVQTRVNGPGTLAFWWKVSSEPFYDGLQLLTNGVVAVSLSGDAEWEQPVLQIPHGNIALRWRYFKDGSINQGQDKGWLDEVTYIANKAPTNLTVSLDRPTIAENNLVTLNVAFFDADALDSHAVTIDWQDGSLTVTNLSAGVYSFAVTHHYRDDHQEQIIVSVSDQVGSVTLSRPVTVTNSPPLLNGISLNAVIFPYDTVVLAGTVSDPGPIDTLRLQVSWGDNASAESIDYSPGASAFLLRHRYSISDSNVVVTLTAADDDGGVLIVRTNVLVRPFPARARALSLLKAANGNPAVRFQGSASANYQIQSSTDLIYWETIGIRTASPAGLLEFEEPGGFAFQRRFYRAIWESQSAGMRFSAIGQRTNGSIGLRLIGLPAATYRIDSSTNFVNWTPAAVAVMDSNGVFTFTDPASTLPRKFYRAVMP